MSQQGERRTVKIGTRGSPLALAQTELVRLALVSAFPDVNVEAVRIQTKGDKLLDRPLADLGDKGLFVAEIEDALRSGRIDCAVHSSKDMPSDLPEDMILAAFLERADPRDVLVSTSSEVNSIEQLPTNARVGTGSPRRGCQLLAVRPDLKLLDVRGNVGTRISKLEAGEYDALVLAAAGLDRLGIDSIHKVRIGTDVMLPAVGQGAIAIEICKERQDMREILSVIDDYETSTAVKLERAFLAIVGGGCHAAVAAHAVITGDTAHIHAMVGSASSGELVRGDRRFILDPANENAGTDQVQSLAEELLQRGGALLDADRSRGNQVSPNS